MLYVMSDYQQIDDNPYITPGKFYPVIQPEAYVPNLYLMLDNTGYEISINVGKPSAHLNDVGIFKLFEVVEITGE